MEKNYTERLCLMGDKIRNLEDRLMILMNQIKELDSLISERENR